MISISQDELATLKEVTELINADSVSKVIIRVNEENKPTGVLKIFDVCELPIVAERFPKMEVREILFGDG